MQTFGSKFFPARSKPAGQLEQLITLVSAFPLECRFQIIQLEELAATSLYEQQQNLHLGISGCLEDRHCTNSLHVHVHCWKKEEIERQQVFWIYF